MDSSSVTRLMSFQDFGTETRQGNRGYVGQEAIRAIGESLQNYQSNGHMLKQKIITLRRRTVTKADKSTLESQVRSMKDMENFIRGSLEKELRRAEALAKGEGQQARVALVKLQKDYERVRDGIQGVIRDAYAVEISEEELHIQGAASVAGNGGVGSGNQTVFQQPRLIQAMQGREVDEALMQERERDIKQINQDLVLVKEMFQDMAELVDSQASAITEIADKTEASHERAKAGLTQVQQAAGHQPGCSIC